MNKNDIIAIFNIDYMKNTKDYIDFYEKFKNENNLIDISNGKMKSMILLKKDNEIKAYISNLSSRAIFNR